MPAQAGIQAQSVMPAQAGIQAQSVMPAQAGIQALKWLLWKSLAYWTPASAGVTGRILPASGFRRGDRAYLAGIRLGPG